MMPLSPRSRAERQSCLERAGSASRPILERPATIPGMPEVVLENTPSLQSARRRKSMEELDRLGRAHDTNVVLAGGYGTKMTAEQMAQLQEKVDVAFPEVTKSADLSALSGWKAREGAESEGAEVFPEVVAVARRPAGKRRSIKLPDPARISRLRSRVELMKKAQVGKEVFPGVFVPDTADPAPPVVDKAGVPARHSRVSIFRKRTNMMQVFPSVWMPKEHAAAEEAELARLREEFVFPDVPRVTSSESSIVSTHSSDSVDEEDEMVEVYPQCFIRSTQELPELLEIADSLLVEKDHASLGLQGMAAKLPRKMSFVAVAAELSQTMADIAYTKEVAPNIFVVRDAECERELQESLGERKGFLPTNPNPNQMIVCHDTNGLAAEWPDVDDEFLWDDEDSNHADVDDVSPLDDTQDTTAAKELMRQTEEDLMQIANVLGFSRGFPPGASMQGLDTVDECEAET